jgi:hypothetical protein
MKKRQFLAQILGVMEAQVRHLINQRINKVLEELDQSGGGGS